MEHKQKWSVYHAIGGVLFSMLGIGVGMWAAYLLAGLLFRLTGAPAAPWDTIIIGILGSYIFILGLRFASVIGMRIGRHKKRGEIRHQFLKSTLDAMNRIAQGDFSVILDVDEHDHFSELAQSVNKMARELGSMENLRQDFISNVSHEIQSPLTSISGFAALLKNDALPPQQRLHYIEIIETEAKRLSKLSDNLMKLSSLESNVQPLSLSVYRLDKQLQNTVLMLEPQWAAKNIELSLSLEEIDYTGDEALLKQVWVNLIHNAVKFTPENGKISISLERKDNKAVCKVADTGIGISQKDKLHIFERFYKADKARNRALGGNGLGLSLAKKIISLHSGTIAVESEPGIGTAFITELPIETK